MSKAGKFMYWGVVKYDLICKEFEREFNEHFEEHVKELVNRDGCSRAWRTREYRGAPNEGPLEQEFWQVYQITDPGFFRSSPAHPPRPPTEKQPFLRDRSNWGRVFYQVLSVAEKNARPGKYWARFELDFHGTPQEEASFENDYADYIASVIDLPGIHRAWQLRYQPNERQIGQPAAGKYMAVYEIDAPENIFDGGLESVMLPWESKWSEQQAAPIARHFSKVLLDVSAPSQHVG